MNKKLILVDVDDVLLNWYSGFHRYMAHLGYLENENTEYDLSKRFDTTKKEMEKLIKTFNKHWEFGTLEPLPYAVECIKKLRKKHYTFVAITSCSTDPATIALRKTNLYWVFGDIFEAVHCINLWESKETHLANYNPTWWVEDKFENAVAGLLYNHKPILMSQPYNKNKNHEEIVRCNDWREIYDHITNND